MVEWASEEAIENAREMVKAMYEQERRASTLMS